MIRFAGFLLYGFAMCVLGVVVALNAVYTQEPA